MFDVVLYQPEIPPNTGNIIRLCANSGCKLHLIQPLGFQLDDRALKRAGLDYAEYASLTTYACLEDYLKHKNPNCIYACSSKVSQHYSKVAFPAGSAFLFGPETRGLPQSVLRLFPPHQHITIPMHAHSRSLNLSNAVAVIVYEAWRQHGFLR
ncbi:MAG: tRNA (cytidine(34)-2'-O)-methyltransferase [Candidatus Oxydemutatoraceae bacterium WSBS_2016_MAG_OTU14]